MSYSGPEKPPGRPELAKCKKCGANIPAGRSVCPKCDTAQKARKKAD